MSVTVGALGVGIGSAALMGFAARPMLRSTPALVSTGLIVGTATGALAAVAAGMHADRASGDQRVGTSLLSPNIAIPAAFGAGLVGSLVYGTQRMYGSTVATSALALGAGLIGAACATIAYNGHKGV